MAPPSPVPCGSPWYMATTAIMLPPKPAQVTEAFLMEKDRELVHLVVTVSGAHAYGFPSPDSDVDIKAIHVLPTTAFLGLTPPALHTEFVGVIDGVEIDYSSNEIQPALAGILAGNGNYLERVLGRILVRTSPELEELAHLTRRSLSRLLHRHYHGFASSKLRALSEPGAVTAKHVLYVLRTALTGAHALRTGEIVTDVSTLLDTYGFADARELIDLKRSGERVALSDADRGRWAQRVAGVIDVVDRARDSSPLPEEAPNSADIETWLVGLRRARL